MTPPVISSAPITFNRLLPPGDPAGVDEIVTDLGLGPDLREQPSRAPSTRGGGGQGRPYVVLNMIATLDGRATLGGRSGPISDPADRALFHGLRSVVDAVMAGAGTVRTERYGPIVTDPHRRRVRREHGLCEQPLACVPTASLSFPPDLPLLRDPDSRVAVLTPSDASLAETGAHVEYVRARREDESLDLSAALSELHDRLHIRTLLCEGGPHLNAELLAAGLVDELFLSISPVLAGDQRMGDEPPLRILAGIDFMPPRTLQLVSALENDSRLFLRYRVLAGG